MTTFIASSGLLFHKQEPQPPLPSTWLEALQPASPSPPGKRSPDTDTLLRMEPPTKRACRAQDVRGASPGSPPPLTPPQAELGRLVVQTRDFLLEHLSSHFLLDVSLPTPEDLCFSPSLATVKPEAWPALTRALCTELHGTHEHYTSLVHQAHSIRKLCECKSKSCACPREVVAFFCPRPSVEEMLSLLPLTRQIELQAMADHGPSDRFPAPLGHDSDTEEDEASPSWEEMEEEEGDYSLEAHPLEEHSYGAAVDRGIQLFMQRVEEVRQRVHVIAIICSPSTYVEFLLFAPQLDVSTLCDNEIARAYLQYHPDILSFPKELRGGSEGEASPSSIYTDLSPWFERLTPVRRLLPFDCSIQCPPYDGASDL